MLGFEQLPDEEVSVVHEVRQLCPVGAQLFDDAGAVHDVGMRDIGHEFVDVVGAKRHVPLAEQRELGVVVAQRLLQRPVDTPAISLPRFVHDDGPVLAGDHVGAVIAVVVHHDHTAHQRMRSEIVDCQPDARLVVESRQHYRQVADGRRLHHDVVPLPLSGQK